MKKDWTPQSPICPSFCRFNRICTSDRQRGVNPLFVEGKWERRAEACFYFEGTEEKWSTKLGLESTAHLSAEQLAELVVERLSMEEAS